MKSLFKLRANFHPTGDQPAAIQKLAENLAAGIKSQTLLGVTGSGKTFTTANVITKVGKPTLVISHNKTLAAQLYQEFKEFFPEAAVHYFVSYYDYYQPEAYIPRTDTYIEKDAKINEMIDALRHASTASLLTRKDVIIVASVSCIYGIGNPEEYEKISIALRLGQPISQKTLLGQLILLQYVRNPLDPRQGHFRTRENVVEIYLPSGGEKISVEIQAGKIANIHKSTTKRANGSTKLTTGIREIRESLVSIRECRIYPAKHFVTPKEKLDLAILNVRQELKERLRELKQQGKILEAARLKQRTEFDLEMFVRTGYVNGIENYSRQLDFREPGSPPHTLIDYFNYAHSGSGSPTSNNISGWLCFIDESHATVPQLRGMYHGDKARKDTLVNYGFRLPSAVDNRPLTFAEFNQKTNQVIYVSATPALYELELSKKNCLDTPNPCVIEQLIRPTGILDPEIEVRSTQNQVQDVITEIKSRVARNERALVLALTKRLAEDIAEYLAEAGIKAHYLHSEVKTLERPETLKKLRLGEYDVIVGINLLREGLDLPEVSFIAILDADKEGFLRNETTLLQIIGRASRHTEGRVVMYADTKTGSIKAAIRETNRRRKIQEEYNRIHDITPEHIKKEIRRYIFEEARTEEDLPLPEGPAKKIIQSLEHEMRKAVKELDFERAAKIRDRIKSLRK